MERRDFMKWGLTGIGSTLITPAIVLGKNVTSGPLGNIYYTKDSPGRWKDKAAGHLPNIGIEKTGGNISVKIITSHEMKAWEHYIVKHILLDHDYQFIDEHLFNPEKDKAAVSTFNLGHYSGTLYALSLCNKHDLWLNSATI
jgi:superoxide reductase